jgi:hypothetical protein
MRRVLATLSFALLAVPALAQEQGDARELEARRREELAALRDSEELPLVEVQRISDIAELFIEDGAIHVRSSLKPAFNRMAVRWPGMPGFARVVMLNYPAGATPPAEPAQMLFEHFDTSRPGTVLTHTTISASINLEIVRYWQTLSQTWQVSLMQRSPRFDEVGGVILRVSGSDSITGESVNELALEAPTLKELRQDYPEEVARYVLPILRDLGQERLVLNVTDPAAWQVLGSPDDVPAERRKRIDQLVKQLDAREHKERQAAADALTQMGQDAAIVLQHLPRENLSPEQRSQIDAILVPFEPLTAEEVAQFRNDPAFLLDCLYSENRTLRRKALERLEQVIGEDLDHDVQADPASQTDALSRLRQRLLSPTTRPG